MNTNKIMAGLQAKYPYEKEYLQAVRPWNQDRICRRR